MKSFTELGFSDELLKAIDKLGFEQPSPIQAAAIPTLLEGKDVVGQSQTGSGKTLAFAGPAIQKVDVDQRSTQILILCPTRELAVQVAEEVHKLSSFKRGLHALPIYGGQSYDRQFFGLKQGAHVVIGTPGRVMDHMRRGTLRLDALKMVILDEVDVMLNMGFREDIEFILQATPEQRQTVFFSATIPRPIQQLIEKYSRDPQNIRIEQKAMTVPTVEQVYYEVDRRFKVELLTRLIDIHDLKLGIIFCNTRRMVDDLVEHLNAQGYSADRLHGEMTQAMRDRVMNRFRKAGLEFLVATDVAARGIDVDDIEVVFNYDLPYDGEDYVHRIGRTGRQGRSGRAISFASGREVFQIRNIERYTNTRITRAKPPTMDEVEEARTNLVLEKIRETLKAGGFDKQEPLLSRLLDEGFSSTDVACALLQQVQAGEAEQPKSPRESSFDAEQGRRGERQFPREDRGRFPREERGGSFPRQDRERRAPREWDRGPREDRPMREKRTEAPWKRPLEARGSSVGGPVDAPAVKARAEVPIQVPASQPEQEPRTAAPAPKMPLPPRKKEAQPKPAAKASRRTPEGQVRLFVSAGARMGINSEDVVNAIQGLTGLSRKSIGFVDLRERHMFVDVEESQANSIISKLNRAELKGNRVKAKIA